MHPLRMFCFSYTAFTELKREKYYVYIDAHIYYHVKKLKTIGRQ